MLSLESLSLGHSSDPSSSRPECRSRDGLPSDYQWQIENFSMCSLMKGESLSSTSFTVDSLDQSEFRLVLYPRGREEDEVENVSCFLQCLTEADYNIRVAISIIGSNKHPIVTKTKDSFILRNGERIGFALVPIREDLVTRKMAYLPKDIFTIRCVVTPEYRASFVCDDDLLDISKDFGGMLASGEYSDFVIYGLDDKKFFVHKVLLTIRGHELARKLGLTDDAPIRSATVDDIPVSVLSVVLGYLYCGNLRNDLTPDLLNEVYEAAKYLRMDDLKRDVFPVETNTIASTTVKVDRRTISWALADFHTRVENGEWPILTFIDMTIGRFVLAFAVKEFDGKIVTQIDIYSHFLMVEQPLLVRCNVLVDHEVGGPKPELCSGEHLFESGHEDTYFFSMIGDHGLLYAWRSLRQYSEKISLVFEFALSHSGSIYDCRNVEVSNLLVTPNTACTRSYQRLSSDMNIVFRDTIYEVESDGDSDRDPGTFSDLRIKTRNGKTVLSHKCILAARSATFRDMLEGDRVNLNISDINVDDISDETLKNLLRYIYSGKTKKNLNNVEELYVAASKYKVPGLLKRCAFIIKTKLTNANVYGFLSLADEHQDNNLFAMLLNHIRFNQKAILNSSEWRRIVTENPHLASRTLSELSLRMG